MTLFDFVKANVSIQDTIGRYVQLKPAGSYLKSSCPFHVETDASFTVSPDKQIFYCFGCHASGDVIAFIAKAENLTQIEAAQHLVEENNLVVPPNLLSKSGADAAKVAGERDNYYRVCKIIADWTHKKLLSITDAKKYLTDRKMSENEIINFKLGYFPGGLVGINNFIKEMSGQGVLLKELLDSGFLIQGTSVVYSPFEERILFPIKNPTGHYCGFGGRIFRANDQRPKYYNSKENEGFSKGKLVFGFDLARKAIVDSQEAFLVEGYMDCISMFQHGYTNTVATLGTACTIDHLKLISRFAKTLYITYDGDAAGKKAMVRITEMCWDVNLELKVVVLPIGQDPASFLGDGGDLNEFISQASDIFTFFVKVVAENFTSRPLADKMNLAEKIVKLIGKVDNPFKRDLLLQQAASVMQLPFQSVKDLFLSIQPNEVVRIQPVDEQKSVSNKAFSAQVAGGVSDDKKEISLLEEKMLSAIIGSMGKKEVLSIEKELIPYFSEHAKYLLEKIELTKAQPKSESSSWDKLLQMVDKEFHPWLTKLCFDSEAECSKDFFDLLVMRFCKHNWKRLSLGFKDELLKAQQQGDTGKVEELFTKFANLKQGLKNKGLLV